MIKTILKKQFKSFIFQQINTAKLLQRNYNSLNQSIQFTFQQKVSTKCFQNNIINKNYLKYSFSTSKLKQNNTKNDKIQNKKSLSIKIMSLIESHITSNHFKKKFQPYHYLQKYSWICLHTWLIIFRLRLTEGFSNKLYASYLSYQIKKLLQEYTKDQVYEYNDNFDRSIYEELKRIQNVMFWSLDEYFYFKCNQKPIEQIIEQDLNLFLFNKEYIKQHQKDGQSKTKIVQKSRDQIEQQMNKVGRYLLNKKQKIIKIPFQSIKKGKIQTWLEQQF